MYIGTWGIYIWAENCGEEYIHPEDINKFVVSNTSVYQCVGEENDYILLKYQNNIYRVKPDFYRKVEGIKFDFGEVVKLIEKPDVEGKIEHIAWHFEKNKAMYFIAIQGKSKSKRYWAEDLKSCCIS